MTSISEPLAAAGRRAPPARRLAFSLVLLLLLWGLVELACWGGLAWLEREKGLVYAPEALSQLRYKQVVAIQAIVADAPAYAVHDPELGWTLRPGAFAPRPGGGYRANAQGLRAEREYAPAPPPGVVRVAAFGDSFTHGSDVAFPDTWTQRLERLAAGTEVLNFGVIGYGPGQAFLRYRRDGRPFRPHVVLLGVMSDNPLRAVNTFRPFYFPRSGLPFAKPRFVPEGDGVRLVPNPLPRPEDYQGLLDHPEATLARIGEHDFFYRMRHARAPLDVLASTRLLHVTLGARRIPATREDGTFDPAGEPFRTTVGIATEMARLARAEGSLPVIVFLPNRRDVRHARWGQPPSYAPIAEELARRGVRVVDAAEGFTARAPEAPLRKLVPSHYSPRANAVVAEHLAEWLEREGLTTVEGVERAMAAERADGG
ncbi:MAG TPA: SGNH/GDSL hydrolase family protein [Thermoanaerobaculia bacterium]|nr:SGNH/GDSL hydrolase family protein [Thermoanaerobaculia bacterium]